MGASADKIFLLCIIGNTLNNQKIINEDEYFTFKGAYKCFIKETLFFSNLNFHQEYYFFIW